MSQASLVLSIVDLLISGRSLGIFGHLWASRPSPHHCGSRLDIAHAKMEARGARQAHLGLGFATCQFVPMGHELSSSPGQGMGGRVDSAFQAKPKTMEGEEAKLHRIRITLSSRNMPALEKVRLQGRRAVVADRPSLRACGPCLAPRAARYNWLHAGRGSATGSPGSLATLRYFASLAAGFAAEAWGSELVTEDRAAFQLNETEVSADLVNSAKARLRGGYWSIDTDT